MLTSTLAGCTNTSTQTKTEWPEIIKIGIIAPISGPAANYGEDAVYAYKYIVDKYNASQSGYKIDLVIEDGKCEGKSASSAAQKLIGVDGVQVIVGGFCSAETMAIGKIAQENKVAEISAVSSDPAIADIGDYVFRFYNDADITKKLANHLSAQGAKKIFVLAGNSDFALGYLKSIKANFSGQIEEQTYQADEKDLDMVVKQLKSKLADVDALIFPTNSDANTIWLIQAFDKEGILQSMKGKLYTNEIITSSQTYAALGNKTDWIHSTQLVTLNSLGDKANTLATTFKKQYTVKGDPLWMVLSSEALSLAIDAAVKAWNNATAIRNYFTSFNATTPRDGYFGKYYFTAKRDAHGLNYLVYDIKDGQLTNGK